MLVLGALLASSCQPTDPRRVIAEDFIDRLFVVIDQASARELATGLAVTKLDEEIRLRGDQEIDESTRKPRVTYEFLESHGDGQDEASSLVYDLRVAPDGADSFNQRLILTLRRTESGWRVGNYTIEAPAEPD